MSRIDDLEERIAALEYEVGTRRGRPGFRAGTARPALSQGGISGLGILPDYTADSGPYGYGSQDR